MVAISGFGGSGKSTLAAFVASSFDGATVIPIDDFIMGERTQRSADWHTFDRDRLRRDVLEAARLGQHLRYQRFHSGEWAHRQGGSWREVRVGKLLIVEGCGVIHPSLMPYYDFSAWVDCPQAEALKIAKARDRSEPTLFQGDDTTKLWDEVWGPNDKDFFDTFRPDKLADALVERPF